MGHRGEPKFFGRHQVFTDRMAWTQGGTVYYVHLLASLSLKRIWKAFTKTGVVLRQGNWFGAMTQSA
jgi:hypothetical protein